MDWAGVSLAEASQIFFLQSHSTAHVCGFCLGPWCRKILDKQVEKVQWPLSGPTRPNLGKMGWGVEGREGFVEDAQYCTCVGLRRRRRYFGEEGGTREEKLKLADSATRPRVLEEDKGMTMEGVWEKERQETATGDNNQAQPIAKTPCTATNKLRPARFGVSRSQFCQINHSIVCIGDTDSSEWFLKLLWYAWFTLQFPLVVLNAECIKGMMWVGEGSVQWE